MDATSKIVGTFILIGSLVTNIPQLYTLLSPNMNGMNFWYFLMLCMIYAINIVYNLQRGTETLDYCENYILLSSTVMIIWLIVINESEDDDDERVFSHMVYIWVFLVFFFILLVSGILTTTVIDAAQIMVYPLLMVHAFPQMITLRKLKRRASFSGVSVLIRTVGDIMRVFTSMRELNSNNLMMSGAVLSIFFNVVLLAQVVFNNHMYASESVISSSAADNTIKTAGGKVLKKINHLYEIGKDKFIVSTGSHQPKIDLFNYDSGEEYIVIDTPPVIKQSYRSPQPPPPSSSSSIIASTDIVKEKNDDDVNDKNDNNNNNNNKNDDD